jgi:hypothetical protein
VMACAKAPLAAMLKANPIAKGLFNFDSLGIKNGAGAHATQKAD